jgi:hypothetical protein
MKITPRPLLIAGACAAAAALLAACSSTATPGAGPAVTSTVTVISPAPAVTVTATATVTVTKTATAAPSKAGFDSALGEWKKGATAISADQGINWGNAATDLTNGKVTDTDTTGYTTAIAHLKELISLPDAQQTPAQNTAYHNDINALNTFFGTPGLYS